jgi:putative heme-binding domain-containing protein
VKSASSYLLIMLSAWLVFPAATQTVNPLPVPQWLCQPTNSGKSVFFRKAFRAELPLLKAILMAACDGTATIYVNGGLVGEVRGHEGPVTFDITSHVKNDANVVAAVAASTNRLAVLLELNGDLARKSWVATDASWMANVNPVAGWTNTTRDSAEWVPAHVCGRVDAQQRNPFSAEIVIDAYNSWKLALKTNQATDPSTFTILPGFKAELLRSAQPDEGSWVTLAFDPKGRLTLAREKRGLLRMTLTNGQIASVEVIDDTLLECRGLLYAHDALYVNANNSKGFYRLRDTDGDDRFDETKLLLQTKGGVGHGRNRVVLGPDGAIWLVHGNNVVVPSNVATNSPLQRYAHDALIPCPFDDAMFDGDVLLPAGHVLRTDAEGKVFELFAGGFRNPLDIAFNRDGEMFTFDADMEWDVGTPWYRPNRVNHVISGADYGWRRGTSKWPEYFPETLPTTLDIGLASPTGIEFGTASRFPWPYNEALYIADWAYGRILAVHLEPAGASYRGRSELFLAGRPLNVTDLTFGADGAMYVTTGGRGTQSGLYRISYVGPLREQPPKSAEQRARESEAKAARELRRRLESFHSGATRPTDDVVEELWPHLGHADRFTRHAARVALEHIDPAFWKNRALAEQRGQTAATALLALSRRARPDTRRPLLQRLMTIGDSFSAESVDVSIEPTLTWLRAIELTLTRLGPEPSLAEALREKLEPLYPSTHWELNHRLCVLLVHLHSHKVLATMLDLLPKAQRSEDLMHYLFYLRYVREGWTVAQREAWFRVLARAQTLQGARDYFAGLKRVRDDMIGALSETEKAAIQPIINSNAPSQVSIAPEAQFVKEWRLDDFRLDELSQSGDRSFAAGQTAFRLAQCTICHRFANEGGLIGPDLTDVGRRFDQGALLESIIEPSKVIDDKYRQTLFVLKDGTTVLGTVESDDGHSISVREGSLDGPAVRFSHEEVARRELSSVSPMPEGLLNVLQRGQILDLLAFLHGQTNQPVARSIQNSAAP